MGKKQRARRVQQQQKAKQRIRSENKSASQTSQDGDDEQEAEMQQARGETEALLSSELAAALGQQAEGGGGGDAVILASTTIQNSNGSNKRKLDARGNVFEEEALVDARKMSKRMKKRLVQISLRKEKEGKRASLYQSLAEQQLSPATHALLRSSKAFSQGKETLRKRMSRALGRHRAGLPVDDEEAFDMLFRKRGEGEEGEEGLPLSLLPPSLPPTPPPEPELVQKTDVREGEKKGEKEGEIKGKKVDVEKKREARRATKARRRQRKEEAAAAAASGGWGGKGGGRKEESEDSESGSESQDEEEGGKIEEAEEEEEEASAEESEEEEEDEDEDEDDLSVDCNKKEVMRPAEAAATAAVPTAAPSSSLGSSLLAQLAKLSSSSSSSSCPSSCPPPSSPSAVSHPEGAVGWKAGKDARKEEGGAKVLSLEERKEAAASIKIPGLEGVDWLSVLEDLITNEEEGEGGNEGGKKEKYVPTEIPLLSPAAAMALREKMRRKGKEEGKEGGEAVVLAQRERRVEVKRTPEIQGTRMQLPVCGMEQEIVEAVNTHDVVILCGETGSGKSTQVPQFLYEYGYTSPSSLPPSSTPSSSPSSYSHYLIGITQPRRVAAVATAQRVAQEMGGKPCGKGGDVAYQIRYDSRGVSSRTRLKFMTDGILLQEIASDLLLRSYSVLVLDEAHERNLNTDILLGLLSRALPLRNEIAREEERKYLALDEEGRATAPLPLRPLKLIIMSATLRVTDFTDNRRLFPARPPPVLRVEARQHPVSVHFARKTALDPRAYVDEVFKKVCKIHRKLPPGGILVFLTGKAEVTYMCQKLKAVLGLSKGRKGGRTGRRDRGLDARRRQREEEEEAKEGGEEDEVGVRGMDEEEAEGDAVMEDLFEGVKDDYDNLSPHPSSSSSSSSENEDNEEGAEKSATAAAAAASEEGESEAPVHVLPLYAMLAPKAQATVFLPPPSPLHRLIVVATNVAETSVTIPNITYVVDCGRVKTRTFHHASGISRYEVQWISQASANQRAGRAGRTGPGHCYRLYSSAVFSQRLSQFTAPEILNLPLEDVFLQMKALGVPVIERFPFPTPPKEKALGAARRLLADLGALRGREGGREGGLTALGKSMAALPMGVRGSKMLVLGKRSLGGKEGGMELVVALVAGISERNPFVFPDGRQKGEEKRKKKEEEEGKGKEEEEEEDDDEEDEEEDEDEEARLLRQKTAALKMARYRQWHHPTSDALGRLRAVGAYTYACSKGNAAAFCRENMLHGPTLARALDLRKQLCRTLNRRFESESSYVPVRVTPGMKPPSPAQEAALRQLLLAGHLDQVARLAPVGTVTQGSKLQRQCAYLGCTSALTEPLYIHPHSSLFSPDPERLPEWVCYQEITRSAKGLNYMTCITALDPDWLPPLALHTPLLSFHPPLSSPPPSFDPSRDAIVFYCVPKYGCRNWELRPYPLTGKDLLRFSSSSSSSTSSLLPSTLAQKKQEEGRAETMRENECRWFARALLEGKVLSAWSSFYRQPPTTTSSRLRDEDEEGEEEQQQVGNSKSSLPLYSAFLNDPPALITHKRPVRKVFEVLQPLIDARVSSLAALRREWARDATFLKRGIKMWVRSERMAEFDALWKKTLVTVPEK
ncbi:hypothetical protein VYU27_007999 [Nannochloropsis oceanica]